MKPEYILVISRGGRRVYSVTQSIQMFSNRCYILSVKRHTPKNREIVLILDYEYMTTLVLLMCIHFSLTIKWNLSVFLRRHSSTSSRLPAPRAQRLQLLSGWIPGEWWCRWPVHSTNSPELHHWAHTMELTTTITARNVLRQKTALT